MSIEAKVDEPQCFRPATNRIDSLPPDKQEDLRRWRKFIGPEGFLESAEEPAS
jgi:hypothetical protein